MRVYLYPFGYEIDQSIKIFSEFYNPLNIIITKK